MAHIETLKNYGPIGPYQTGQYEKGVRELSYTVVDDSQKLEAGHLVKFRTGKGIYQVRSITQRDPGTIYLVSLKPAWNSHQGYDVGGDRNRSVRAGDISDKLQVAQLKDLPLFLLNVAEGLPTDIQILVEAQYPLDPESRVRELRRRRIPPNSSGEQRREVFFSRRSHNYYEVSGAWTVKDQASRKSPSMGDVVRALDGSKDMYAVVRIPDRDNREYFLRRFMNSGGVLEASDGTIQLTQLFADQMEFVPLEDIPGVLLSKVAAELLPSRVIGWMGKTAGFSESAKSYKELNLEESAQEVAPQEETPWGGTGLDRLDRELLRKACMRFLKMSRVQTHRMDDDEMRAALQHGGYRPSPALRGRIRVSKARSTLAQAAEGLGWTQEGVTGLEVDDLRKIIREELRFVDGMPKTFEGKALMATIVRLQRSLEGVTADRNNELSRITGAQNALANSQRDRDAYQNQVNTLTNDNIEIRNTLATERSSRSSTIAQKDAMIRDLQGSLQNAIPRTPENVEALEIGMGAVLRMKAVKEEAKSSSRGSRFLAVSTIEDD